MPFRVKTQTAIFTDMANRVLGRTVLTDIASSGRLYQTLMALAGQVNAAYLEGSGLRRAFSVKSATGDSLDERARDYPVSAALGRQGAQRAVGKVAFYRAGVTGTTPVPAGSRVITRLGRTATTLEATAITPTSPAIFSGHAVGRDSGPVLAVMDQPGADGNVLASEIVGVVGAIPGIQAAFGSTPFRGGTDREEDPDYLARILDEIRSLSIGSPYSIESAVRNVVDPGGQRVEFSSLVEDIVNPGISYLYIDDGNGSAAQFGTPIVDEDLLRGATADGGERLFRSELAPIATTETLTLKVDTVPMVFGTDWYLRPTDGFVRLVTPLTPGQAVTLSYTPYEGLIRTVQIVVDGNSLNRLENPGLRAAGTIVRVLPVVPQILTIVGSFVMLPEAGVSKATIEAQVSATAVNYVNTLGIEEEFVPSELVKRLKSIAGCHDVILTAVNDGVSSAVTRKRSGSASAYRTDSSRVQITVTA